MDDYTTADAVEFKADLIAQAVTWTRLEWWPHSVGHELVALERNAEGFAAVRQVGTIWSKQ